MPVPQKGSEMQPHIDSRSFPAAVLAENEQLFLREPLTLMPPMVEKALVDQTAAGMPTVIGPMSDAPLGQQAEPAGADPAVLTERGLMMSLRQRWSSVVSRVVDVCSRMHLPSCCC